MSREPVSALSERLGLLHLQIGAELLECLWLSRYDLADVRALHAALNEHALAIRKHAAALERKADILFIQQRDWAERVGETLDPAPYELRWLAERPQPTAKNQSTQPQTTTQK